MTIVLQRVIHKYPIPFRGPGAFNLLLPRDASALCVQLQHGQPQVWVWLDQNDPMQESRTFHVVGTGQPVELRKPWRYVSTWQDGPFVWHMFQEAP